ncbi:MAG: ribosomal protein S5-alanine N-acetyltransferase [Pseudomonadota bacterium]
MILSERLLLFLQGPEHLQDLRAYYLDNAAHLDPWEPARSDDFHLETAWRRRLLAVAEDHKAGRALKLVIRARDGGKVLGVCNYSNIIRGSFQACHLGYSLAETAQGQGLMYEALEASLHHVFTKLNLHRVMANYIPENERSGRLLTRLGFEQEGFAKDYLHINGVWRDHVLTAKINPMFRYTTQI